MDLRAARIGFDARLWDHPGIGRYQRELFLAMNRRDPAVRFRLLMHAKQKNALQTRHLDVEYKNARSSIYSLAEQWELFNFSREVDLLHVPHFNIPLYGPKKLVVTVHDLIYLKDARYSGSNLGRAYVKTLFKIIEDRAHAVLVVSEYTRGDLLNDFPKLEKRVFVTPEAASFIFQPMEPSPETDAAKKKFGLEAPFVLFVGSLKKHKNVSFLIRAMEELREQKGVRHDLVLVGRKDEKDKQTLALLQKNKDFVRCLEQVRDEELVALYNLAEVFVMPSLWEGFGLPALEAMACGTPVLSSNRASLPEVVGEAGLLFDPTRVDALKELLYNVLQNRDLRQKMRVMGFEQAKKFSWDKTAFETLQIYERVLG